MYPYLILLMCILKNIDGFHSVNHVIRCTRRFTAGYCEENVRPVWMFVFQKQDCVIRMGCPPSLRANRFRKYSHCIRRCKVLVDLYTHILLNETALRAGLKGSPRRDIDGKVYSQTETQDFQDSEIYSDARDLPHYDNDGNDPLGDVMPSNIDGDTEIHTFLDVLDDNKHKFYD